MRKITIIGAALMAIVALSAVAASMASAALPEFLPNAPVKPGFSIKSGAGTLSVSGQPNTECKKDKGSGAITGAKTATLTVDFEECKILSFIEAHSLGDPNNTILLHVTGLLCWIKKGSPLEVGILLTPTGPVHIEAPSTGTLVVVSGSVVGRVEPINKSQTTGKVVLPATALACEGETDSLTAEKNETGGPLAAGEVTTEEITFEQAIEVMG